MHLKRLSSTALLAGAVLAQAVLPALAQEARAIEGVVFIAGRTVVDPPEGEPRDTHAYVTLKGAGALEIYRAMRAAEEDDLCRGEGWKMKIVGPIVCSHDAASGATECDFSLDVSAGNLAEGRAC
jgi:hypothetical protein